MPSVAEGHDGLFELTADQKFRPFTYQGFLDPNWNPLATFWGHGR
jgi:hypothetical protein